MENMSTTTSEMRTTDDEEDLKKKAVDYVYYLYTKEDLSFDEYFELMKELNNVEDGDNDVILDVRK